MTRTSTPRPSRIPGGPSGAPRPPWWDWPAMQPCRSCFCTSVGTGPFDPCGSGCPADRCGRWFHSAGRHRQGQGLARRRRGRRAGSPAACRKGCAAQESGRSANLRSSSTRKAIAEKDMLELFNASFWDEVQFSCINCGTCTFLCPTCWCFDIQDEVCGDQGDRLRIWDSCMFPLFTLHGSGHNPRNMKLQRVRQRFMHKLKYYQDKYQDGRGLRRVRALCEVLPCQYRHPGSGSSDVGHLCLPGVKRHASVRRISWRNEGE